MPLPAPTPTLPRLRGRGHPGARRNSLPPPAGEGWGGGIRCTRIAPRLQRNPMMLPTERLDYSAIPQRRKLVLPGGARLAVWVIVNVEEWDINETMPRTVLTPPAGGSPLPDIPNWAWHE